VVGAVLVWGLVSDEGRRAATEHYGFADVLSVEEMLRDLGDWQLRAWADWVGTRRRWTDELLDWLAYRGPIPPTGGQDTSRSRYPFTESPPLTGPCKGPGLHLGGSSPTNYNGVS